MTSDTTYNYFAVRGTTFETAGITKDQMKNWTQYGIFFIAVPKDQKDNTSTIMYRANPKLDGVIYIRIIGSCY